MASGIRILLNFNQCQGPLLVSAGVEEAIRKAHTLAGVTVMGINFVEFPDGTVNFHSDLAESHCSGGTYLEDRHVAFEINMCHESRDNTELARALARELLRVFCPNDYVQEEDWVESRWQSR